jgi:Flp pilus assembly protein TadD
VKLRDPRRAVEAAKKAVELAPKQVSHWQTLAWAEYRAGNSKTAVAAMKKARELGSDGCSSEWFLLAMAHWQLGDKDQARKWYDQAVQWMDKNEHNGEELRCFRSEAAELLGLNKKK